MMRILLFLLCIVANIAVANAQQRPTIADVFRQMPDSLMPYLTANNRLDMLDFMEAKMKAEVTNELDGVSEMTMLTGDSLTIVMNPRLRIDLLLTERDSLVVEMRRTYTISEHQTEVVRQYFSIAWCPLSDVEVVGSALLRRDEEVFARPHF